MPLLQNSYGETNNPYPEPSDEEVEEEQKTSNFDEENDYLTTKTQLCTNYLLTIKQYLQQTIEVNIMKCITY